MTIYRQTAAGIIFFSRFFPTQNHKPPRRDLRPADQLLKFIRSKVSERDITYPDAPNHFCPGAVSRTGMVHAWILPGKA